MLSEYQGFCAYALLVVLIPGLPFMMILALNNNPNRWLSNWLVAHRKPVMTGYMASNVTLLLSATYWLTYIQVLEFLKVFLVPSLILTGCVLYPHFGRKEENR